MLILFCALTLPLMPLQQLFVWFWPRQARTFPMHYHRLVCRILGVRLEVTGAARPHGPLLIAANHVSWLDIVVLSAVAPVSFIAKKEVAKWPFFGTLARLQRTVFVDRDRRHATADGRDEMRERLKAGDTLVLFAEGTSGDGRSVLPFKSSFFGAADTPGVVVQPVTIAYRGHRNLPMNRRTLPTYAWYGDMDLVPHLLGALRSGPIEVTVICHLPLSLGGELSRKALARHAEAEVRTGLVQALHRTSKIR
ncbi:1-acyl-sn-glycerol-3-phosphate acyltransferase [Aestuariivirga litoralis]|uniref:1-acyl-sn-glycerol-3-phosphate acyltransferase n=1 Tax=Aestuariivirga litoralis TaxID=2650924 RepID=A0A2W2BBG1_9HYPH|nr:lysophospholipid acyltransferase family protein [Aestuariivirga litoralis]PZF77478.1 1-acyl-sn-glycerol-3-phosphate acyltransferase [Aestuariivirga litoralis]